MKTMSDIDGIYWHDYELESVVEIPGKRTLVFNVQYPENWDQNIFVPRKSKGPGSISRTSRQTPLTRRAPRGSTRRYV